jgi:hypothetical protein
MILPDFQSDCQIPFSGSGFMTCGSCFLPVAPNEPDFALVHRPNFHFLASKMRPSVIFERIN